MNSIQIALSLFTLIVLGFTGLGLARSWRREATPLGALVLGWSLILFFGPTLIGAANRLHLIAAFTLTGGFDAPDSNAVLRALRARPFVDPNDHIALYTGVFALCLGVGYLLAQRGAPRIDSIWDRLVGAVVGLMNGYLIGVALLRYASPSYFGDQYRGLADLVGTYIVPALAFSLVLVAALTLFRIRPRPLHTALRPARPRRSE